MHAPGYSPSARPDLRQIRPENTMINTINSTMPMPPLG
jgi:hypothetical protein